MGVSTAILLGQKDERRDRKTDERETAVRIRIRGQFRQVGHHPFDRQMLLDADHGRAHAARRIPEGLDGRGENRDRQRLGETFGAVRGRRQLFPVSGLQEREPHVFG